jgi:uncharacterized protein
MKLEPIRLKNHLVNGFQNKQMLVDVFIPHHKGKFPLIIFSHGFKGFKDWGHFNWMCERFMEYGIAVIKFNFSHNGIIKENPSEISDKESFGKNNYSIELFDIGKIIDFAFEFEHSDLLELNKLTLVGHSRGGAISFLKAARDKRVKNVVLWAAPYNLENYFLDKSINEWNTEGVVWVKNKRNNDLYPLYKQFYEDYLKNKMDLDIELACDKVTIPVLLIHGTNDEAVPYSEAEKYYNQVPHSILIKMDDAGHTFGAKHPFETSDLEMMNDVNAVIENTAEFIIDSDIDDLLVDLF